LYQQAHFNFLFKGLMINKYKNFYMDIGLTIVDNSLNKSIQPLTVHGMLWLQTHFEDEQWEAISENRVIISEIDSQLLCEDANSAGIQTELISDNYTVDVLPKTN